MKRTGKKIISIVLAAIMGLSCIGILSGCESNVWSEQGSDTRSKEGLGTLEPLDGNLYYDTGTKVIYYMFIEANGYKGFGYMSPYYSENGKLCRYDNGKIVEVEDESNNATSENR